MCDSTNSSEISKDSEVKEAESSKKSRRGPKIYTKAGDLGFTTLLGSSSRVPKWDRRIKSYGAVDELNAYMGQVREVLSELPRFSCNSSKVVELRVSLSEDVTDIQRVLFLASSWLSRFAYIEPNASKLGELDRDSIQVLETRIDQMTACLPVLKNFILQQGDGTSFIHIARTVCRRAEYRAGKAIYGEHADKHEQYVIIMEYLNRLSDWLFTAARYYAHVSEQREIRA